MKAPLRSLPAPRGFTLIELLIVIAIIAILATLGVAGGRYAIINGQKLEAKTAMKGIESAVQGYHTEYLRMPAPEGAIPLEDNAYFDTTVESGRALLNTLLARPPEQSPRGHRFWVPAKSYTSSDGLRDPWRQHGYRIILDYSRDGSIDNPYAGSPDEEGEVNADVIIYSAGPNKTFEEGGPADGGKIDDVRSWR
jgi:prepilin-type N-terminal cleavage/methylation domain-containing protein